MNLVDDFGIHSSLKAGKLSEGLKAIDWLPLPLLRRLSSLRFDKDLLCKLIDLSGFPHLVGTPHTPP